MFEEMEVKILITSTNTITGLVSTLQLVDTTPSERFAKVRNATSEAETQRIIYPPMELPKKEINDFVARNSPLANASFGANALGQQRTYGFGWRPHLNA